MAIGQDFYPDQGLQDIANLSQLQSVQAPFYGQQAAQYADPFMGERGFYQNQLRNVVSNPGSITSSPYYQFAYDQGLNALQRKGNVRSGNKLAQLMQYGQGLASQAYGQQVGLLSPLAMSGTSPAAAGIAYQRGTERGQDYSQMAAASRSAARTPQPTQSTQLPWYMQPSSATSPSSSSTMPYGGYGGMYGGMSGQVDYGTSGYTPSANAGTGYAINDQTGATSTFGQYDPFSDPYWGEGVASDVLGSGDYYG